MLQSETLNLHLNDRESEVITVGALGREFTGYVDTRMAGDQIKGLAYFDPFDIEDGLLSYIDDKHVSEMIIPVSEIKYVVLSNTKVEKADNERGYEIVKLDRLKGGADEDKNIQSEENSEQ